MRLIFAIGTRYGRNKEHIEPMIFSCDNTTAPNTDRRVTELLYCVPQYLQITCITNRYAGSALALHCQLPHLLVQLRHCWVHICLQVVYHEAIVLRHYPILVLI